MLGHVRQLQRQGAGEGARLAVVSVINYNFCTTMLTVAQVQEEVGEAGRAALAILQQAGRREQRVTGLKLVEALQVHNSVNNTG